MDNKLIKEVKTLISDVEKTHRYSMSKIYGLSNKVFNRNEQPQSCASCLIRKVSELKKWVKDEEDRELLNPYLTDGLNDAIENNPELSKVYGKSKRKRKEANNDR